MRPCRVCVTQPCHRCLLNLCSSCSECHTTACLNLLISYHLFLLWNLLTFITVSLLCSWKGFFRTVRGSTGHQQCPILSCLSASLPATATSLKHAWSCVFFPSFVHRFLVSLVTSATLVFSGTSVSLDAATVGGSLLSKPTHHLVLLTFAADTTASRLSYTSRSFPSASRPGRPAVKT